MGSQIQDNNHFWHRINRRLSKSLFAPSKTFAINLRHYAFFLTYKLLFSTVFIYCVYHNTIEKGGNHVYRMFHSNCDTL